MLTYVLLAVIVILALQCWRYRICAREHQEAFEQTFDDYQSLGRDYSDEIERLEVALEAILAAKERVSTKIAMEAMRHTGSVARWAKYAPEKVAESKREAALDAKLIDAIRSMPASRWSRVCGFLSIWWRNPSLTSWWVRINHLALLLTR